MYEFQEKDASKALSFLLACILASGLLLAPLLFIGMSELSRPFFLLSALSLLALALASLSSFLFLFKTIRACECKTFQAFSALSFLFTLIPFLLCFLPVTERDALVHHLAVPKWWLEAGRIYEISWHEWSYYPMLMQLAFVLPLKHGFESLSALTQWGALISLSATLSLFLRTQAKSFAACLVLPLTLSTPIFLRLAAVPLVDLSLALFSSSALVCLLLHSLDNSKKYLIFSGLFLGLALATKYNAFLFLPIFLACASFLFLIQKEKPFRILQKLSILTFLTLFIISPWLAKNYSWTGNPVYPLAKKYFQVNEIQEQVQGQNPVVNPGIFEKRKALYGEGLLDTVSIPLRVFFQGQDGNPKYFDGKFNFLFLAFFVLPFLRTKTSFVLPVFLLTLLYLLLALATASPRVRYLAPIFGPFILLSALSLDEIQKRKNALKIFIYCAIFAQIFISSFYLYSLAEKKELLRYFSSRESRDSYLERQIPEQKLLSSINAELPEQASLYLLYTGDRFFYLKKSVRSAGYDSGKELRKWLREGRPLHKHFFELGVTHILYHKERLAHVLQGISSTQERMLWNEFQTKHLRLVKSDGLYLLWEILP